MDVDLFKWEKTEFSASLPFVSTATSLLYLFEKIVYLPEMSDREIKCSSHYTWLKNTSTTRFVILLIPVIGNFIIVLGDFAHSSYVNKKLESLKDNVELIREVDEALLNNKKFMFEAVIKNPELLNHSKNQFRFDYSGFILPMKGRIGPLLLFKNIPIEHVEGETDFWSDFSEDLSLLKDLPRLTRNLSFMKKVINIELSRPINFNYKLLVDEELRDLFLSETLLSDREYRNNFLSLQNLRAGFLQFVPYLPASLRKDSMIMTSLLRTINENGLLGHVVSGSPLEEVFLNEQIAPDFFNYAKFLVEVNYKWLKGVGRNLQTNSNFMRSFFANQPFSGLRLFKEDLCRDRELREICLSASLLSDSGYRNTLFCSLNLQVGFLELALHFPANIQEDPIIMGDLLNKVIRQAPSQRFLSAQLTEVFFNERLVSDSNYVKTLLKLNHNWIKRLGENWKSDPTFMKEFLNRISSSERFKVDFSHDRQLREVFLSETLLSNDVYLNNFFSLDNSALLFLNDWLEVDYKWAKKFGENLKSNPAFMREFLGRMPISDRFKEDFSHDRELREVFLSEALLSDSRYRREFFRGAIRSQFVDFIPHLPASFREDPVRMGDLLTVVDIDALNEQILDLLFNERIVSNNDYAKKMLRINLKLIKNIGEELKANSDFMCWAYKLFSDYHLDDRNLWKDNHNSLRFVDESLKGNEDFLRAIALMAKDRIPLSEQPNWTIETQEVEKTRVMVELDESEENHSEEQVRVENREVLVLDSEEEDPLERAIAYISRYVRAEIE